MSLTDYRKNDRQIRLDDIALIIEVLSVPPSMGDKVFLEVNRGHLCDGSDSVIIGTALFSLSTMPPRDGKGYFSIGRVGCDIAVTGEKTDQVSQEHIRFSLEDGHVYMEDVSSNGCSITIDEERHPRTTRGSKLFILPGCEFCVQIDMLKLQLTAPQRNVPQKLLFKKKQEKFLKQAEQQLLGSLNIKSAIPTAIQSPVRIAASHESESTSPKEYYWFKNKIGKGSYGTVHKVVRLRDRQELAAKKMKDSSYECQKEIELLKTLQHERVVAFFDVYRDMSKRLIIVMEFCEHGTLSEWITRHAANSTRVTMRQIIVQIAEGLQYIHSKGYVHRDIKPVNILLKSIVPIAIKIADFGASLSEDGTMTSTIGTDTYRAPEIERNMANAPREKYTKQIDMFAFGRTISVMCDKLPESAPDTELEELAGRLTLEEPTARPNASAALEMCKRLLEAAKGKAAVEEDAVGEQKAAQDQGMPQSPSGRLPSKTDGSSGDTVVPPPQITAIHKPEQQNTIGTSSEGSAEAVRDKTPSAASTVRPTSRAGKRRLSESIPSPRSVRQRVKKSDNTEAA